jgi:NAD(P)-dependent dehydrogenase (short-subunit alcohol dehydrogenase family)
VNGSRDRKVVLITGGTSGFGKASVDYLAHHGHRAYGTSRRADFRATQRSPRFPQIIPMDVCDTASIEAAVEFVLQREGRLDVLINNAGFALAGAIEQTSIDEAKAQFETNFFGVHRVCRAVLPAMRDQGSGLIVNIGSMAGLITLPFQGFYCGSKYALEAFTEALRMEAKPFGVQVTLVDPGDFATGITRNRVLVVGPEGTSPYASRQERALDIITRDEQNGADPSELAALLGKIISRKRVRSRYLAGVPLQRLAVWAKRLLPAPFFEKLIMAYYRI